MLLRSTFGANTLEICAPQRGGQSKEFRFPWPSQPKSPLKKPLASRSRFASGSLRFSFSGTNSGSDQRASNRGSSDMAEADLGKEQSSGKRKSVGVENPAAVK
jgi:hypothetical protein